MSYEIVKSIVIKNNKVYFTSAVNNILPRTFERYEVPAYSKLYQDGGLDKLLPAIAVNVWERNYHLQSGSKLCRFLSEAYSNVYLSNPSLYHFLDTKHGSEYVSNFVLHKLDPTRVEPRISDLNLLRNDRAAVLDICSKNPEAFNYASLNIQKDRDIAKEHIIANRDKLMFSMPLFFKSDKELAMLALEGNGTTYRNLSSELQTDKDIVRLAFDESREGRRYFEHLPDLIPHSLREDKAFMTELISLCPKLHIFRAADLLEDRGFALTWVKAGGWHPHDLKYLPDRFMKDTEFQAYILNTYKAQAEPLKKVKDQFDSRSITISKLSLSSIISNAETKSMSQEKSEVQKISERDR